MSGLDRLFSIQTAARVAAEASGRDLWIRIEALPEGIELLGVVNLRGGRMTQSRLVTWRELAEAADDPVTPVVRDLLKMLQVEMKADLSAATAH